MKEQPLAEVFGFPTSDYSTEAKRVRKHSLCPFNNRVPNCTKDKVDNPLGVCSVLHNAKPTITCPVRFRENWIVAEDAAKFFFEKNAKWTTLTEVRLNDGNGQAAGNIDVVLVSYDANGTIKDYGALEVQAVYISGNIRGPFDIFMSGEKKFSLHDWDKQINYPRPDFLSSSRKRLAPQLLFKGGILNGWKRKMAVALDRSFFETLPPLSTVPENQSDLAWLIYELKRDVKTDCYKLCRYKTVYTSLFDSMRVITVPVVGNETSFIDILQTKLESKLKGGDDLNSASLGGDSISA